MAKCILNSIESDEKEKRGTPQATGWVFEVSFPMQTVFLNSLQLDGLLIIYENWTSGLSFIHGLSYFVKKEGGHKFGYYASYGVQTVCLKVVSDLLGAE